jgi:hypothetical protein
VSAAGEPLVRVPGVAGKAMGWAEAAGAAPSSAIPVSRAEVSEMRGALKRALARAEGREMVIPQSYSYSSGVVMTGRASLPGCHAQQWRREIAFLGEHR